MKPQPPSEYDWPRRRALEVASMLPYDTADGLVILDMVRELVLTFLQGGVTSEPEKAPVVTLVRVRPDLTA